MKVQGGCLCGKLRYRATGELLHSTICHCANCRRACGSHAVAWITFPAPGFSFVQGDPAQYSSSTGAVWTFCANCGSTLTYQGELRQDQIDITTGTVDDPEAFPPTKQVNADEKLSWVL
jgi:hypothetical protein